MNKKIEILANDILENSGVYRKYSDMDLANAMLVFVEVFMSKIYDAHKKEMSQKQLEELAKQAGEKLREIVLFYTDVDLHKAVKNEATNIQK